MTFEIWIETGSAEELGRARELGIASAFVVPSASSVPARPGERIVVDLSDADLEARPGSVARRAGRDPVVLPASRAGFQVGAVLRARGREVAAYRVRTHVEAVIAAAAGARTVIGDISCMPAGSASGRPAAPALLVDCPDAPTARAAIERGADGVVAPRHVLTELLSEPASTGAGGFGRLATSHASTDTSGPTIGSALAAVVAHRADAPAIVHHESGDRLRWSEVDAAVRELAGGLLALGVGKGDRVTLWAWNRIEWPLVQLATGLIGAVLVTANPELSADELGYVVEHSGSVALIAAPSDQGMRTTLEQVVSAAPAHLREVIVVAGGRPARPPAGPRWSALSRLRLLGRHLEPVQLSSAVAETGPDDVVNVQYTSGTTGRPKGVTLTHRSMLDNARAVAADLGLGPDDRLCLPVPFHHCFGCVLGTLATLTTGATLVVPGDRFSPRRTLDAVDRERCTVIYGVPTMFAGMLAQPLQERNLSTLRTGICSGAPVPPALMADIRDRMHVPAMTIVYGLTEASPVVTSSPHNAPEKVRFTTVGRPLPGYEARAVDPATGRAVGTGATGELQVRGGMLMAGYLDNPRATAAAIDADGWLHTGDLASQDSDGNWRIVGRLKDVIIRGGENIYPARIEAVLASHPAVAHAAVIGVPDDYYGELARAFVQPHTGGRVDVDELRQLCTDRLAPFEVPAELVVVDSLPLTASGKLRHAALREQLGLTGSGSPDMPTAGGRSNTPPPLPLLAAPLSNEGARGSGEDAPTDHAGGGPRPGWRRRPEPRWIWRRQQAGSTGPAAAQAPRPAVRADPRMVLTRAWSAPAPWSAPPSQPAGRWAPRPRPSRATVRRSVRTANTSGRTT